MSQQQPENIGLHLKTKKHLPIILLAILSLSCFLAQPQSIARATNESPASTPLWTATLDWYSANTPVISDRLVYVTSDAIMNGGSIATLSCHNSTTGERIWSSTELLTQFTVTNGYIYASYKSLQNKPYTSCLNASTGVQIWNNSAGTSLGKPAVKDGVVYVACTDKKANWESTHSYVFALNASNGKALWRYSGPRGSDLGSIDVERAPFVVDDYVCVFDRNGLYVLDSRNGNLKWKDLTRNLQSINYANGVIYISRYDEGINYTKGEVDAFNITSGEKFWSYSSSDISKTVQSGYYRLVVPISEPAVSNNVVFVLTQSGEVTALNASDGIVIWQYQLNTQLWLDDSTTTPATSTDGVFVSSPSAVYALSNKGELLWEYKGENSSANLIESYPTYDNGIVYVGLNTPSIRDVGEQHYFYALSAANGKEIWHCTVDRNMLSTPVVANGTVYFGGNSETRRSLYSTNGVLYALKAATDSNSEDNANDYGNSWIFIASILAVIAIILAAVFLLKKRRRALL